MNLFLSELRFTDPRTDKESIERRKESLLSDSFCWILRHHTPKKWREDSNNTHNQLLWIKGDPGKRNIMLLCGVIEELRQAPAEKPRLAYFFCQANDGLYNNVTNVLRGILYNLIAEDASLSHRGGIRTRWKDLGPGRKCLVCAIQDAPEHLQRPEPRKYNNNHRCIG